jgi:hypothetical protein
MNLFRSEEHLTRWLGGRDPGMTTSVTTLSALAHAWWGNRLDPDWAPRSREASQAILDGLGLTGPAWSLG